jgi:hypothetical protein
MLLTAFRAGKKPRFIDVHSTLAHFSPGITLRYLPPHRRRLTLHRRTVSRITFATVDTHYFSLLTPAVLSLSRYIGSD